MGKARRAETVAGPQWPATKSELWPLSDLVPSARNARRHPPEQIEQLAKLIERFGWTMPVLCRENGEIIAGHGRVLAAERQGIEEVPVIVARGWSDDQCRAYMLADNRIAESATWDDALLRVEIEHLLETGQDAGDLGFSQHEVDTILNGWNPDPSRVNVGAALAGMKAKVKVTCEPDDKERVIEVITEALAEAGIENVEIG